MKKIELVLSPRAMKDLRLAAVTRRMAGKSGGIIDGTIDKILEAVAREDLGVVIAYKKEMEGFVLCDKCGEWTEIEMSYYRPGDHIPCGGCNNPVLWEPKE